MRPRIRRHVVQLYLGSLAFFALNKFVIRPLVEGWELPRLIEVVIFSSPNAVEAIVGMTSIAVLLLLARRHWRRFENIRDAWIYSAAAVLTLAFVLTQEFRLHDLGGRNVYDPNDAVASVVGVLAMWLLFSRWGVLEPARAKTPSSLPRGRDQRID